MLLEGASILAPLLDEDELQAKLCPHVLEMCDDKVPNLRIDAVKCCKNVGQRVGDDWREKLLGKLREKVAPACNHMRPACNAVRPGLLATPCTEALGHPCCDGVHPPVTRLHPPCTPIRLGDGRRPGRQVLLQRFHRRHHRLIVVGLDGRRGREGQGRGGIAVSVVRVAQPLVAGGSDVLRIGVSWTTRVSNTYVQAVRACV